MDDEEAGRLLDLCIELARREAEARLAVRATVPSCGYPDATERARIGAVLQRHEAAIRASVAYEDVCRLFGLRPGWRNR